MKVYRISTVKKFKWIPDKTKRASDRLITTITLGDVINLGIYKARGNKPYACRITIQTTQPEEIELEGKARGESLAEAFCQTLGIFFKFEPPLYKLKSPLKITYDDNLNEYGGIKAVIEAIGSTIGLENCTAVQRD